MDDLPVTLRLSGRTVILAGQGENLARKVRLLEKTAARLSVHEDTVPGDVAGAALVISAFGDERDSALAARAKAAGVPVNVVDVPALSTLTLPAIIDRGPVTVAIATGGTAPVLGRRLRAAIEHLLPANLGGLASLAGRLRPKVKAGVANPEARRRLWEQAFDGAFARAALAGNETQAEAAIDQLIAQGGEGKLEGSVALVGAGPGDPELLTVKAVRALEDADIIFYDDLVSAAVLDRARRDADRIYVGKRAGRHAMAQDAICRLLADAAKAGKRVVRLKGGDPLVFGRGGEEAAALRAAGVPVTIVPGITAAMGAAASLSLPLTHRDHAQQISFVTAHGKKDGDGADWPALAKPGRTLAVYMGGKEAARVSRLLIEAGRAASTPVAVVTNATLPGEQARYGTLAGLPALAALAGQAGGPVLIIIGETVAEAPGYQLTAALAAAAE